MHSERHFVKLNDECHYLLHCFSVYCLTLGLLETKAQFSKYLATQRVHLQITLDKNKTTGKKNLKQKRKKKEEDNH